MKHSKLFLVFFSGLLLFSSPAYGQDGPPHDDFRSGGQRGDRRPNLFAELGLAPEQVQEIRRQNQERRPQMQAARRRMGDAQRNLDMAIYADTVVSEAEFQSRLKEFQAAEAELAQVRFAGELAVRKVLTPEQLVRFRELRRRFAEEARGRFENGRPLRDGRGGPPPVKDGAIKKPLN